MVIFKKKFTFSKYLSNKNKLKVSSINSPLKFKSKNPEIIIFSVRFEFIEPTIN